MNGTISWPINPELFRFLNFPELSGRRPWLLSHSGSGPLSLSQILIVFRLSIISMSYGRLPVFINNESVKV